MSGWQERRWGKFGHGLGKPGSRKGGRVGGGSGGGGGKAGGGKRRGRSSNGGGGGDPFGADVHLLLNFDGTHGGTDAVDESQNAYGLTWVGADLSNVQTYNANYGTSAFFDGTNDLIHSTGIAGELHPGAGVYTLEVRARMSSVSGLRHLISFTTGIAPADPVFMHLRGFNNELEYSDHRSSFARRIKASVGLLTNTWYEFAVTFDGDVLTMYVDGVVVGTNDPANNTMFAWPNMGFSIGARDTNDDLSGYIQAIRWTLADRYEGSNYTVDPAKWAV